MTKLNLPCFSLKPLQLCPSSISLGNKVSIFLISHLYIHWKSHNKVSPESSLPQVEQFQFASQERSSSPPAFCVALLWTYFHPTLQGYLVKSTLRHFSWRTKMFVLTDYLWVKGFITFQENSIINLFCMNLKIWYSSLLVLIKTIVALLITTAKLPLYILHLPQL